MNPSRSPYMTPQAFTDHYGAQLRKALPNLVDLPIVKLRMNSAMAGGLNWSEGFAYALEQRHAISALRAEVCAARTEEQSADAVPSERVRSTVPS